MAHMKQAGSGPNNSDLSNEARVLKLAQLDFLQVPPQTIQEEMDGPCWATIRQWRALPEYKQAAEELKEAWHKSMLELPNTASLRKQISHGLSISLKRLIKIVSSSKTSSKDLIAACKLFAQMDGRFLGTDVGDGDKPPSEEQESIASELVSALRATELQRRIQ